MSSIPSHSQSCSSRYPDLHDDSFAPRPRNARARSASPSPKADETSHNTSLPQQPRRATPADLHPWGGKFVQLGHTLSQYSARVQVFFEGLVGLSTPNLDPTRHDETVAAMAQRLFEIRVLCGEAAGLAQGPMSQDVEAAEAFLRSQRQSRDCGSRINAGIHGAMRYLKSWFGHG